MKTVCLNMIVKDESSVILRCLSSVRTMIDYWVIVDTGSTDGTQKMIRDALNDIPGELFEQPWVNFARNRNDALALARHKADYILFIDADERLDYTAFDKNQLTLDFFVAEVRDRATSYLRVLLVRDHPGWIWKGVIHESIWNDQEMRGEILKGVVNESNFMDGCRANDPEKYLKDIEILKRAIGENSSDLRNYFYLGQSYIGANDYSSAYLTFEKRAALDGDPEDVFWSLYMIGLLQQTLKKPSGIFIPSYCRAFLSNHSRSEPLFRIAAFFFDCEAYLLGYLVTKFALQLPSLNFFIRIEKEVYDYELSFLMAHCAFFLGKHEESRVIFNELLLNEALPPDRRSVIEGIFSSPGKV